MRSLGFQTRGSNPLSFEVQNECKALGEEIKCNVRFKGTHFVTDFGRYQKGFFKDNADIAGMGVCHISSLVKQC
jgi:hypothetical protein